MKLTSFIKNTSILAIKYGDRQYVHYILKIFVIKTIHYLLARGVKAKQRIVLVTDHDDVSLLLIFAASAIGFEVVMPYNLNRACQDEWSTIISDMRPVTIIFSKNDPDLLKQLSLVHSHIIPINFDLINNEVVSSQHDYLSKQAPIKHFFILYTSGTTGKPKAISMSEAAIIKQVLKVSKKLKFTAASRIFMSGLMNNTTGIIFSFGAIAHECTLIYPQSRDINTWPAQVAQDKVTHLMLRPASLETFLHVVEQEHVTLPTLKVLAYGAALLPRHVLHKGRSLLACDWIQGYGLSETFGPFCWLTENDHRNNLPARYTYCIGRSDDTFDIAIRPLNTKNPREGELLIRGPGLMQGYYDVQSNQVIPHDGWYATGDYVEIMDDHYIALKGRISTTVLTQNGHQVNPQEVELVVQDAGFADEALLLNYNNSQLSDTYGAILCLHLRKTSSLDGIKQSLLKTIQKHLSREKWPDYMYVSQEPFPRNDNNKIIRNRVQEMISPQHVIKLFNLEDRHHVSRTI